MLALAVVVGFAAPVASGSSPQQEALFGATEYGSIVEAYRKGAPEDAIERMLELEDEGLRFVWEARTRARGPAIRSASPGELRYIHGEGDPSVTQVQAAAKLHTDTADALWSTDVGLAPDARFNPTAF